MTDPRSSTLTPGLRHVFSYVVPESKTVPSLYPEAEQFQAMPKVFATGFMVGLMEWTCIQLLAPHLAAGEGSLGTHIDVSHLAATPPGLTVTVEAELTQVDGRRVWFDVSARDDRDLIGAGRHERAIVGWSKFEARVAEKLKTVLDG
ncbi:thioesterase family protein [Hansschlegelia zhihuaiae]|uniref:Thioesterase n=1 Tax=Hansschlegelia zhihuaiae TaxID=405005 RepID=A0A4Q0MNP0_9HYPH|nr:thioesterase family protein [Hansschlegelia zhihuaiae]RXF74719.1 thioesterase [Hansschlegelia zhihuaiae]